MPLITRTLADLGYDCGLVGKLHLSAAHGRVEARPDDGYRVFKWSHHPKPESFWPTEQHAYQQWLYEQGVDWDQAYGADDGGRLGRSRAPTSPGSRRATTRPRGAPTRPSPSCARSATGPG